MGKKSICGTCKDITCMNYSTRVEECRDYEPMTNADRVRAMTDEELARWLVWHANSEITCEYKDFEIGRYAAEYRSALDWLREEVAE